MSSHYLEMLLTVVFRFSEADKRSTAGDVRKLAEELAKLMQSNRVRLSKGASGTYYLSFFDEEAKSEGEEPFRCVPLPKQQ